MVMKATQSMLLAGTLLILAAQGCGGKNGGPKYATPSVAGTAMQDPHQDPDPTMGTSDLNHASNSSAPPGAPSSLADPAGHPPAVSAGAARGKDDVPINSGAGDAQPESMH